MHSHNTTGAPGASGETPRHNDHITYNRTPTVIPDEAIIEAWERWVAAHDAYDALPFLDDLAAGEQRPEELALWSAIDEVEAVIRAAVAKTPLGATIQMLIALYYDCNSETAITAIKRADIETLVAMDDGGKFDRINQQMIIAALRSLKAMEVRHA